jgi:hypothetical protein
MECRRHPGIDPDHRRVRDGQPVEQARDVRGDGRDVVTVLRALAVADSSKVGCDGAKAAADEYFSEGAPQFSRVWPAVQKDHRRAVAHRPRTQFDAVGSNS